MYLFYWTKRLGEMNRIKIIALALLDNFVRSYFLYLIRQPKEYYFPKRYVL
jgi:hypothetical protein